MQRVCVYINYLGRKGDREAPWFIDVLIFHVELGYDEDTFFKAYKEK